MKNFSNQRFPVDISYGSSGGPEYSTDITIMKSGREQRNVNWSRPRYRYNAALGVRSKEQLWHLIQFFRAHLGRAIGFRYKDWLDYQAIGQNLTQTSQENQYQLVKSYHEHDVRMITKPVKNSLTIYANKKKISNYEINYDTGIVTFNEIIKAELKANFEFDVPVRFDTDRLCNIMENYGVYSTQDVPIIEIL